MKKNIVWLVIGAIIIAGGGFWGGMRYGKSSAQAPSAARFGNFAGGTGGQFGRRGGALGAGNGGFVAGQIIAKDDRSITVELRATSTAGSAAGSKIVFFSDTTAISKSTSGSPGDLTVGEEVVVAGTANADGSVTAQTIRLEPLLRTEP